MVLVGREGCRIHLADSNEGFSADAVIPPASARAWRAVWAVDVEADGDLDLLLSDYESAMVWLRNNGDLTFDLVADFVDAANICQWVAADFDGDGDVDWATLDTAGTVAVWQNQRGGKFERQSVPTSDPQRALAVGDVDQDGRFDLVSLSASGALQSASWRADALWTTTSLARWSPAVPLPEDTVDAVSLFVADVDNNGAVDLVASRRDETAIWLAGANAQWLPLVDVPAIFTTSVIDINADGRLDLIGLTGNRGVQAINRSQSNYQWLVITPLANTAEGDHRINSFALGGRIEVRAGTQVQAAIIQSPQMHFGLGQHSRGDVARIVWPNGTVQAEFDLQSANVFQARQRLKGSCPWVFAYNGQQFQFVKDFLWRSPLGLRINAQDTAGVTQTEDWIKLPGSQLASVQGRYQIRITGELWETLFFDEVQLWAVDHPADVEVFVDERFIPAAAPAQEIIVATPPQAVHQPTDLVGHDLTAVLAAKDGTYAADFPLGEYQGVTDQQGVEFQLPAELNAQRPLLLMATGWVYPTDSSINVAISQTSDVRPHGLVLEQRQSDGHWEVVLDNLGFPAGKNKDVIIRLPAAVVAAARRLRLRTNMEVYWDFIGWSYEVSEVAPRVTSLPMARAELRNRGFSKLLPLDRRRPDTPLYEIASTAPRWLDLEGYYTRYGEVHPLLRGVDDRYVIMNAGDELVFEFDESGALPAGWRRDFVLIGDGWVKDGDFNTAFSRWVRPLPAHQDSHYVGPLVELQHDPVYQQHAQDWLDYHTRYVTPRPFQRGLWTPWEWDDSSGGGRQ